MGCFDEGQKKKRLLRYKLWRYDLMMSLPYEKKLQLARAYTRTAIKRHGENLMVACSFGKDSTMVVRLAIQVDPDIKVVFANTLCEYPETYKFRNLLVKEWGLNFTEVRPEITFWKLKDRFGYPTIRFYSTKSKRGYSGEPRCCYHLKKKPMGTFMKEHAIEAILLGTTAAESYQRRMTYVMKGPNYYTRKAMPVFTHKVHPIAYFTEEEVWRYTKENSLPVNGAYEKYHIPRVGCIPCTSYKNWDTKMPKHSPKVHMKIRRDMGRPTLEDDKEYERLKRELPD